MSTERDDVAVATLLAAALAAAARGWHVFPLRPGSKRPALHGAARCPRIGPCAAGHAGWEQRATTDRDRIRSAWRTGGPAYNVGVACGPSRLVVIDLDTASTGEPAPAEWTELDDAGGAAVLAALAERAGQPVPATFTIATPSGGQHRYYRAPAGAELRNTAGAAGLGWKIDTRAAGGYVVAAGSVTQAGAYVATDDRPPVELPTWLSRLLRPAAPPVPPAPVRTAHGRGASYLAAAIEAETARVRHAPTGQRNASLYVAAVALGQLVAGGALAENDARAALLAAAARHLALRAYSARQANQTITSGLRAGARRPRTIGDAA